MCFSFGSISAKTNSSYLNAAVPVQQMAVPIPLFQFQPQLSNHGENQMSESQSLPTGIAGQGI